MLLNSKVIALKYCQDQFFSLSIALEEHFETRLETPKKRSEGSTTIYSLSLCAQTVNFRVWIYSFECALQPFHHFVSWPLFCKHNPPDNIPTLFLTQVSTVTGWNLYRRTRDRSWKDGFAREAVWNGINPGYEGTQIKSGSDKYHESGKSVPFLTQTKFLCISEEFPLSGKKDCFQEPSLKCFLGKQQMPFGGQKEWERVFRGRKCHQKEESVWIFNLKWCLLLISPFFFHSKWKRKRNGSFLNKLHLLKKFFPPSSLLIFILRRQTSSTCQPCLPSCPRTFFLSLILFLIRSRTVLATSLPPRRIVVVLEYHLLKKRKDQGSKWDLPATLSLEEQF